MIKRDTFFILQLAAVCREDRERKKERKKNRYKDRGAKKDKDEKDVCSRIMCTIQINWTSFLKKRERERERVCEREREREATISTPIYRYIYTLEIYLHQ